MSACNHDWNRTNVVTTDDGYDTFRCSKCGAIGSAFGLSGVVVPDGKKSGRAYGGMTAHRGRGKSLETILREAKERSDGLEWSREQYEKRIAKGEVQQMDSTYHKWWHDAFEEERREHKDRKWHKHKSKGIDTKYGGPCCILAVNWDAWDEIQVGDVRLKEMMKA